MKRSYELPRITSSHKFVISPTPDSTKKCAIWLGKFLDERKENASRYKYLKHLNSSMLIHEFATFYDEHSNTAFLVFHEHFSIVTFLSKKGTNKTLADEYSSMAFILNKIIIYNQARIAVLWQFNGIFNIIHQFLCKKNTKEVRKKMISICLTWCIGLGKSITEEVKSFVFLMIPGINDYSYDDIIYSKVFIYNKESNVLEPRISDSSSYICEELFIYLEYKLFHFFSPKPVIGLQKSISISSKEDGGSKTGLFFDIFIKKMSSVVHSMVWTVNEKDEKVTAFLGLFKWFNEMVVPKILPLDMFDLKKVGSPDFNFMSLITLKEFKIIEFVVERDKTIGKNKDFCLIRWIIWAVFVFFEFEFHVVRSDVFDFSLNGQPVREIPVMREHLKIVKESITYYSKSEKSKMIFVCMIRALLVDVDFMNFCVNAFVRAATELFNYVAYIFILLEILSFIAESDFVDDIFKEKSYLYSNPACSRSFFFNIFFTVTANIFHPLNAKINKDYYILFCTAYLRIVGSYINKREACIDEEQWNNFYEIFNHLLKNIFTPEFCAQLGKKGKSLLEYLYLTYFICFIRGGSSIEVNDFYWKAFYNNVMARIEDPHLFLAWSKSCEIVTSALCKYMFDINISSLPLDYVASGKRRNNFNKLNVVNSQDNQARQFGNAFSFDKEKFLASHRKTEVSVATDIFKSCGATNTESTSSKLNLTKAETIGYPFNVPDTDLKNSNFLNAVSLKALNLPNEESDNVESSSIKEFENKIDYAGNTLFSGEKNIHFSNVCNVWKKYMSLMEEMFKYNNNKYRKGLLENCYNVWKILYKCHCNQVVSLDNKWSPPMPEYIPPLFYFSELVFDIFDNYDQEDNQLLNVALSFMIDMYKCDHRYKPPSKRFLCNIYKHVLNIVKRKNNELITTLLESCSQIFYYDHPGISLLVLPLAEAFYLNFGDNQFPALTENQIKLLVSLIQYILAFSNLPVVTNIIHNIDERIFVANSKGEGKTLVIGDCFLSLQEILYRDALLSENINNRMIALSALVKVISHHVAIGDNSTKSIQRCTAVLLRHLNHRNPALMLTALSCLKALNPLIPMIENSIQQIKVIIVEYINKAIYDFSINLFDDELDSFYCLSQLMHYLLEICVSMSEKSFTSTKIYYEFIESVMQTLDVFIKTKSSVIPPNYEVLTFLKYGKPLFYSIRPGYTELIFNNSSIINQSRSENLDVTDKKKQLLISTIHYVKYSMFNLLGQYPGPGGSVLISSQVSEEFEFESDFPCLVLGFNDDLIMTVIECSDKLEEKFDAKEAKNDYSLKVSKNYAVIILRNAGGKFCWKINIVDCVPNNLTNEVYNKQHNSGMHYKVQNMYKIVDPLKQAQTQFLIDTHGTNDFIVKIMQTSLSIPKLPKQFLLKNGVYYKDVDDSTCEDYLVENIQDIKYPSFEPVSSTKVQTEEYLGSDFTVARHLLLSLGILEPNYRNRVLLMKNGHKLARDLKFLDKKSIRNTCKIAIIYVAKGQEDKQSIMSNTEGSLEYENFLRNLGWEVKLEKHEGFLGGLCQDSSTGDSTIYYSDVNNEVIFHVSTRLPTDRSNGFLAKLRHIGNDEIHIVWSEHDRPFRRGIINTEFADVIIVIYPMKNSLCRIQLITRPDIVVTGCLKDGEIMKFRDLAPMILSSVIAISSILTFRKMNFEHIYYARSNLIKKIIQSNFDMIPFDSFCAKIVDPKKELTK